ncbi:hydrogenase maturation protease [Exilibacterium tricleocarpae]|uniref:hydrogenase maturation protease n=1 Tax=Exilibacterium tricleocarpae TaxID=2591008 RepID=UPI0015D0EF28|nr:hydrogenase maturation protease [Exilibacterium tricleocarpae]
MKIVALGNAAAGDDGAALIVAKMIAAKTTAAKTTAAKTTVVKTTVVKTTVVKTTVVKTKVPKTETANKAGVSVLAQKAPAANPDIVFAGRPGAELLDLLDSDGPVILLDVVTGAGRPGQVIRLTFGELINHVSPARQVSSHGFGPAEVLQLGQALGRCLPEGCFIGIEGMQFEPGAALSAPVSRAIDAFADRVRAAIGEFARD